MGALLRTLARTGFRRGLAGAGGRGWLLVGLFAGAVQFLRRKSGQPKVEWSGKIEPGQTLIVRHYKRNELPGD